MRSFYAVCVVALGGLGVGRENDRIDDRFAPLGRGDRAASGRDTLEHSAALPGYGFGFRCGCNGVVWCFLHGFPPTAGENGCYCRGSNAIMRIIA